MTPHALETKAVVSVFVCFVCVRCEGLTAADKSEAAGGVLVAPRAAALSRLLKHPAAAPVSHCFCCHWRLTFVFQPRIFPLMLLAVCVRCALKAHNQSSPLNMCNNVLFYL